MAEDVQGATLLAVGSSSPELLTALLGVIFYPDDNPGPGTNVCSAVFNLCIIVGLVPNSNGHNPTYNPTKIPTLNPTKIPTQTPTHIPSENPT
eukprot:1091634_1